jgi:hypothetical protein
MEVCYLYARKCYSETHDFVQLIQGTKAKKIREVWKIPKMVITIFAFNHDWIQINQRSWVLLNGPSPTSPQPLPFSSLVSLIQIWNYNMSNRSSFENQFPLNKCLLSLYCAADTILGAGTSVVNKVKFPGKDFFAWFCSPGWPQTHNLPDSVSQVLGFQVCTSTPSYTR